MPVRGTDGANTATAFTDEGTVAVPTPRTTVVEAVGAGGAFAAGFLAGLLQGATTANALRGAGGTARPVGAGVGGAGDGDAVGLSTADARRAPGDLPAYAPFV
ncbi:PfkB family carbohydrate kinase [Streptomyces sp. UG1]|uniref:PfkB family carbohydrate kinase n=1 Tax=Streptomyces sp. UG1 TaxID=3417652 RepID=UPI003CED064C